MNFFKKFMENLSVFFLKLKKIKKNVFLKLESHVIIFLCRLTFSFLNFQSFKTENLEEIFLYFSNSGPGSDGSAGVAMAAVILSIGLFVTCMLIDFYFGKKQIVKTEKSLETETINTPITGEIEIETIITTTNTSITGETETIITNTKLYGFSDLPLSLWVSVTIWMFLTLSIQTKNWSADEKAGLIDPAYWVSVISVVLAIAGGEVYEKISETSEKIENQELEKKEEKELEKKEEKELEKKEEKELEKKEEEKKEEKEKEKKKILKKPILFKTKEEGLIMKEMDPCEGDEYVKKLMEKQETWLEQKWKIKK